MAEEIDINIVADTTDATKNVQNLSDEIKSAIIPSIGLAEAIKFGVDSVIEFGKASVEAYKEATDSVNKLNFALSNIGGEGEAALKRLTDQADQLEGTSLFDAERIQESQTTLIQSLNLTAREVEQLTPRIIDLASAQGIDLSQATDQVINGLNGQEKALKKAGVDFQATGDRAKDLGNLLGGLDKFAGASAISLEKNGAGARKAEVEFGKLQEKVGEDLVNAFHDFSDVLFDTENFFNGNIAATKALTEVYDKYKETLQDLSNRILDAGDKQRDLTILYYQDIKGRRALTFEENIIYTNLLKDQTAQVNANTENIIKRLEEEKAKQKEKSDKKTEQVKKELTDYEKLIAKQKELDVAITNAITAGDVSLASNLNKEFQDISKQIALIDVTAEALKTNLNATPIEIKIDVVTNEDTELIKEMFVLPDGTRVTKEQYDKYLEELEKARQLQQQIRMAEFEAATILADAGLNILNQSLQAQYESRLEYFDKEKELIDEKYSLEEEKLQNKAASERLTDSQTQQLRSQLEQQRIKEQADIDKKVAELKKKAFNRDKAFNLVQAGIEGALAITKAIGSAPPPANIPAIILTSAGVAAQVATIASARPPAFAKGGLIEGEGTGTSDSINIKASNGESIINARSTSIFAPLLSAINEIGGGKAFVAESLVPSGNVSVNQQQVPIVKAYVVDSEITQTQKRSSKINRLTTLE